MQLLPTRPRLLALCFALAIGGFACGGGSEAAAIDDVSNHYDSCGLLDADGLTLQDCQQFFETVFSDLEERCSNPSEVRGLYQDSIECVATQACTEIFTGCDDELAAYQAGKVAGGPGCQPDDD